MIRMDRRDAKQNEPPNYLKPLCSRRSVTAIFAPSLLTAIQIATSGRGPACSFAAEPPLFSEIITQAVA